MEYPGYGVYKGEQPTADTVIRDAETVFKFVTNRLKWSASDVIVCGRSIGSGPACYLSARYNPACLVLISPHTSIRGIVKDQWFGSVSQYLIAERFRNIEEIKKVECPTFLLHGLKDNLVSPQHSRELCDACGGPSFLLLPEEMDHNNLDVIGDFLAPLSEFFDTFSIQTCLPTYNMVGQYTFDPASSASTRMPGKSSSESEEEGDFGAEIPSEREAPTIS